MIDKKMQETLQQKQSSDKVQNKSLNFGAPRLFKINYDRIIIGTFSHL
jgi:hypothetical protein